MESELYARLNAGMWKQPNAGRRMVEASWAVHLDSKQPAVLSVRDRRRRSTDEARISSPELDEPGLTPEWAWESPRLVIF